MADSYKEIVDAEEFSVEAVISQHSVDELKPILDEAMLDVDSLSDIHKAYLFRLYSAVIDAHDTTLDSNENYLINAASGAAWFNKIDLYSKRAQLAVDLPPRIDDFNGRLTSFRRRGLREFKKEFVSILKQQEAELEQSENDNSSINYKDWAENVAELCSAFDDVWEKFGKMRWKERRASDREFKMLGLARNQFSYFRMSQMSKRCDKQVRNIYLQAQEEVSDRYELQSEWCGDWNENLAGDQSFSEVFDMNAMPKMNGELVQLCGDIVNA